MRIAFMGTPEFAVPTLRYIYNEGHNILAVFTNPDKPVGRKQIYSCSPVKKQALEYNIPIYQPVKFGLREKQIISELNLDVILVVAYGKILPEDILDIPKFGSINLHPSLLPKYRGASPIQTSIINCEDTTGVSIIYVTKDLDAGDILKTLKTKIGENETAAELSNRLSILGAEAVCDVLKQMQNTKPIKALPQDESCVSFCFKITKDMARIDFNVDCYKLHKFVCGLYEWPCAYCYIGKKRLKVYKTVVVKDISGKPGQLLDFKRFLVGCKTGAVEFLVVQLEGKKKMEGKDFLNGSTLRKGDFLA